jgi:zinc D-Ala-D-Ala dipeptidase
VSLTPSSSRPVVYNLAIPAGAKIVISGDYEDISNYPSVQFDLRYGTPDNFVYANMYGEFRRAYLHAVAAAKFREALRLLHETKPGWRFIIFDALRPRSVQRVLWQMVVGKPEQTYVADPDKGSMHNYGMALDLSLLDSHAVELDMGTPFDDFCELAQPRHEERFVAEGMLSREQVANRHFLRDLMEKAGFIQLPHEWWHFNALAQDEIKASYLIVE